MARIRFCPGYSTLQHSGEDGWRRDCLARVQCYRLGRLCRNSMLDETFWFHDTACSAKSILTWSCYPSTFCSLQFFTDSLATIRAFFRRWQNAYPGSQELGNDCRLEKMLLVFFKLGQTHLCSLFAEIIKMVDPQCSEASFFEADTCLAPGRDDPLQRHCPGMEGLLVVGS